MKSYKTQYFYYFKYIILDWFNIDIRFNILLQKRERNRKKRKLPKNIDNSIKKYF